MAYLKSSTYVVFSALNLDTKQTSTCVSLTFEFGFSRNLIPIQLDLKCLCSDICGSSFFQLFLPEVAQEAARQRTAATWKVAHKHISALNS